MAEKHEGQAIHAEGHSGSWWQPDTHRFEVLLVDAHLASTERPTPQPLPFEVRALQSIVS